MIYSSGPSQEAENTIVIVTEEIEYEELLTRYKEFLSEKQKKNSMSWL